MITLLYNSPLNVQQISAFDRNHSTLRNVNSQILNTPPFITLLTILYNMDGAVTHCLPPPLGSVTYRLSLGKFFCEPRNSFSSLRPPEITHFVLSLLESLSIFALLEKLQYYTKKIKFVIKDVENLCSTRAQLLYSIV